MATGDDRWMQIQGVDVPRLIYGTAWKEERTAALTRLAIESGFRGIDTANQRRHYDEAGVGEGLRAAGTLGIFLQTKFTSLDGQDARLPYERNARVSVQVAQSVESSLRHLGVETIDSYLLHGPSAPDRFTAEDWEAWAAMEAAHGAGKVRLLGVSNVTLRHLAPLYERAKVLPSVVQNRCFARMGWDRALRQFCREHGIAYQAFSLLTANPEVLRHPKVRALCERTGKTAAQVVFRFALEVGMIALTGTTSARHMAEDLGVYDFALEPAEVDAIEQLMG
jgi:diketogulonate reductase-like aldo/keto reductase